MVKVYDKVKLKNLSEAYLNLGIRAEDFGDCLDVCGDDAEVLFYNAYNRGDYAVVWVKKSDLIVVDGDCKSEVKKRINELKGKVDKSKNYLNPIRFDESCCVKLIKCRKRYGKFGLEVGMVGVTALDYAIFGKTLVDFGGNKLKGSSEHMNLISVNLEDIQIV